MKRHTGKGDHIDTFNHLKGIFESLSKSQKKIALYIFHHYETAPDMAAVEIAKAVGVSEATVVRFAAALGFDGYPEFKKKLKEDVNSKLTTLERIDLSINDDRRNFSENKYARKVLKKDIKSIFETMDTLQSEAFEESVKAIASAEKVFIIGFRTTSMLTEYLGYYLNLILPDVRVVNHSSTDFYEQLIKSGEKDVAIAVSFPRYAQKTVEAVRFLKKRNTKIISITDSHNAPLNPYADYVLPAKTNVYSFVDSLVAPMSLINALVIAVGGQNLERTKEIFEALELAWQEGEVYAGNNLEIEMN